MDTTKKLLLVSAAFGAAALSMTSSERDVSVSDYHCVTDQAGKYSVKILASDNGAIFREGGVKRFDIDARAGTCKYTDNSGDTMVFHMKPNHN